MKSNEMRRIIPLSLFVMCVASLCLYGCATTKKKSSIPGITAPHERISQLREQRKRADQMSPEAVERLAAELAPQCGEEEDPMIRVEMVLTLGALNCSVARQALLSAGQDPDDRVRIAACKAWAGIDDESASSELARILSSDMDQDVRLAAAKALGQSGGPHALAALGQALEDRDPAMQYVAMESLKQTSGEDYGRDVRLWKQYVQGETPVREEKSIAQRVREFF